MIAPSGGEIPTEVVPARALPYARHDSTVFVSHIESESALSQAVEDVLVDFGDFLRLAVADPVHEVVWE